MIIRKYSILVILCISFSFFCNTSYSQERYQTEFSIEYLSSEYEDNDESKMYGLTAGVYFSQVDTGVHPYAEAAFLERVGSIHLLVGKGEMELGSIAEADGPMYGAMLTYMKPNLPIALQAIYAKTKLKFDLPLDGDTETDLYGIEIGRFFYDGLLFSIGYSHSETGLTIPIITVDETMKYDDYTLYAKFVKEKMDGTAYNIEGSLGVSQFDNGIDDGSNTIIEVSGDYYFNRKISLGGELEINTGDYKDDEGKALAIDFKTFLNPSFSIDVGFEKFLADNDEGEDEKTFFIDILARF